MQSQIRTDKMGYDKNHSEKSPKCHALRKVIHRTLVVVKE